MRSIPSPVRPTAERRLVISITSALRWSIGQIRRRATRPVATRTGLQAPFIDRKYLAYLRAVDAYHCTNCSHGEGLLSCVGENGLASTPFGCPLRWTPGEMASRPPSALVTELVAEEHANFPADAKLHIERPTRDARTRPTADVMSHLGP